MKLRHWQSVWEIIEHIVQGVLLGINIGAPSFQHIAWFLFAEYLIGIVNTIGWWTWLNSVDKQKS